MRSLASTSERCIALPRASRVDRGVASALMAGGVLATAYAHGQPALVDIAPAVAAAYAYRTRACVSQHRRLRVRALRRLPRGSWQARCAGQWHAVAAPTFTHGPAWMHVRAEWSVPARVPPTEAVSPPIEATLWQCQFQPIAWRQLCLLARTHQPISNKGDR